MGSQLLQPRRLSRHGEGAAVLGELWCGDLAHGRGGFHVSLLIQALTFILCAYLLGQSGKAIGQSVKVIVARLS